MVTIAHISDLHCSRAKTGKIGFNPKKLASCIAEINALKPNVVVVTGDLTMFGFKEDYSLAKKHLSKLKAPVLVIPGNHDSRYCGYDYFDEYFGYGDKLLELPGISMIGIDTSVPDLDEGQVGRGKLRVLTGKLEKMPKTNCKVVAMHHHLIAVPKTGRERSTVNDAGDVLEAFIKSGVDLVLCGHRHAPYSWLVNNVVIVNAGSASAVKLRANIPNSYNIIKMENNSINIFLKEIGKQTKIMAQYDTATDKGELYIKSRIT